MFIFPPDGRISPAMHHLITVRWDTRPADITGYDTTIIFFCQVNFGANALLSSLQKYRPAVLEQRKKFREGDPWK